MKPILTVLASLLFASSCAFAQTPADELATLRGMALDRQASPPRISRVENENQRRKRAYPMQPPTIPHKIDGYQVDLNVNKCMSCHSRRQTEQSQAPMVSVTHYMDREGNFLANVSPRRYFCQQCHVAQTLSKPGVGNDFVDIDEIIAVKSGGGH